VTSVFTGIIESTGTIEQATPVAGGRRLRVSVGQMAGECKHGDSVCISGVCLTVTAIGGKHLDFDVITETLDKTTLGALKSGDRVNLERSLRVGDRLDGHFVQGHVDGRATVEKIEQTPKEHVIWFRGEDSVSPYVIPKGSITIDGVSLTIAAVRKSLFSVALIPTTLDRTTLSTLKTGHRVNIESDIIVRTIVHRLEATSGEGGITVEALQRAGFA
jgi:riboflavin synthase